MTAATHPTDHAPVIPEITAADIGKPLCCVKCGGVLHLVCGDAPATTGTPAVVDRTPDPARREPDPPEPRRCRTCAGEIEREPGKRGRPPLDCPRCRAKAAGGNR